jgi:hypothetical protein
MAQAQLHEVGKIHKLTWLYLAAMAAVFGYWWNSMAAGIFLLLLLILLTTFFSTLIDGLIGVLGSLRRIENMLEGIDHIEDLLERKNTVHIGTIPR